MVTVGLLIHRRSTVDPRNCLKQAKTATAGRSVYGTPDHRTSAQVTEIFGDLLWSAVPQTDVRSVTETIPWISVDLQLICGDQADPLLLLFSIYAKQIHVNFLRRREFKHSNHDGDENRRDRETVECVRHSADLLCRRSAVASCSPPSLRCQAVGGRVHWRRRRCVEYVERTRAAGPLRNTNTISNKLDDYRPDSARLESMSCLHTKH